jgi:hypothetical protein
MRQLYATFRKKIAVIRKPADPGSGRRPEPALHGAKAILHIFCSENDFFLIRLHRWHAGPISAFQ